jgi:hypothetical protein
LIVFPLCRAIPILAASGLLLAGCHADVTFALDVYDNGTALATTREVLDDQVYRLALSQNTSGDPLDLQRLQRDGWTISRTYDDNGNHVLTITKLLSQRELSVRGASTALRDAWLPFSAIRLSRSPGFFTERDSLTATIPALLPWAQSALDKPYAAFVAAMAASAVALHLELRTPGKVLATNGEQTPSGYARWDLGLQAPTTIAYSVRVVHFDRVAALILIVLALMWLGTSFLLRLTRYSARSG